ncbi:23S rRNA (uracil(747)-C(5))-methyltransferase RlmC [Flexivirga endophytica]|uniref:23S rRNA (Uracil(747)-C(5))-methyltransferase RlmC n=1 Tax=Flexivirga endophytica TaxID=1849103 RepID=A0A916WV26_9MICO|nr:methyltransferase domain-containing protein [Flexivirga endophytica]GGB36341.1 23S rRNA (uracil(747)-C(5))-methyltransferase RlmC [Flexivirga endophytica]GHB44046.1 23S rRNA (uracil(747)-C(5))-methyltransferase RlmC [Flexivirga endophytica]
MQCDYFDAGTCRSCTLMGQPYDAQLIDLQTTVAATLSDHVAETHWDTTAYGPESHFRNKAKLAVAGTRQAPTFGILDRGGHGVDLRDCGLYEPGLHRAVVRLADFVTELGLTPYDVTRRSGELKHLIVTHSPDGESMIRFVLRSPGQLGRIERALPGLLESVPGTRVVSVNLLPEHKAALEGDEEIFLTSEQALPMRLNDITLHLRPRSFFQTNTAVAAQLYRQAQQWISQVAPTNVLDLFCGVGGFALHAAADARPASVRGVEISAEAVASARLSAGQLPGRAASGDIRFETGDATGALDDGLPADLVIVNPPRRGIGELADALERSGASHVLYSSCNSTSLATDLDRLPSFRVADARLFDMFPQTRHHEVLLLLER